MPLTEHWRMLGGRLLFDKTRSVARQLSCPVVLPHSRITLLAKC